MIAWIIVTVVSILFTVAMTVPFVYFALIALDGHMSFQAAINPYLFLNCMAWPFMVAINLAVGAFIMMLAKQEYSFLQLVLVNAGIVTAILGLIAMVLYFG